MHPACPNCGKYQLTIEEVRYLMPGREATPKYVVCPKCKTRMKTTGLSRILLILCFIAIPMATVIGIAKLLPDIGLLAFGPIIGSMAFTHYLVWPQIIRVAPWNSSIYWLPKSRIVGYTVYLVLPILIMIALIAAGIHFGWGM